VGHHSGRGGALSPLAIRLYLGGEYELLTIVSLHILFALSVFPLFRCPGAKRPRGS
jgi:hypothetical protein